ncbi:hypothetical protein NST62_08105 [Ureibacillus sp. FSL K6-8385]|uniref:Uncharacterized protein n=1 Tax=Ureibacillus terrenus TaxID=118246 RepID=A0A540V1N5_9BACL|nr:hypothetical protein [Ureibacillus terrenus]MED3660957.1 hypothetical protein [Ureibacillus terrenus]TQE90143.1 hypothetical protein FKZ59_11525 [Ureibacillus terrenus]
MKRKYVFKNLAIFMCTILLISTLGFGLPQDASAAEIDYIALEENLHEEILKEGILDEEISNLLSTDNDLYKFLEGLEQLPPGIEKQGPNKIAKWITNKTGVEVIVEGENLIVPSLEDFGENIPSSISSEINNDKIGTMGVVDCIIAVGLAIGSVGFPASKLLKLKSALNLLGGINKTVQKIYDRYKLLKSWNYRTSAAWKYSIEYVSKSLPSDLRNAFLDFFGIANIIRACT